mgnify:CR=1 FL=1
MEDNKLAISTKLEDIFAQFVLNSWKDKSLHLVKRSQKTEAEIYRQPVIWNSFFTSHWGHAGKAYSMCMCKIRSRAQSIGAWITFLSTSIDQRIIMPII